MASNSQRCPHCGGSVSRTDVACMDCGQSLIVDAPAPPEPQPVAPSAPPIGQATDLHREAADAAGTTESMGWLLLTLGCLALLVGIGVFITAASQDNPDRPPTVLYTIATLLCSAGAVSIVSHVLWRAMAAVIRLLAAIEAGGER